MTKRISSPSMIGQVTYATNTFLKSVKKEASTFSSGFAHFMDTVMASI